MGTTPDYIVEGLIQRGMPRAAALGFAGNFQVESGFDPGINERNPTVAGSRGGYGLAQWTGPRRRQLETFAASRGVDVSDPDLQMDFLIWELQNTEKRAGDAIFAAQDPTEAARLVSTEFLRPGIPHLDARIKATADIAGQSGATASGMGTATIQAPQTTTAQLTPLQQRAMALRDVAAKMVPAATSVSDAYAAGGASQATPAPIVGMTPLQERARALMASTTAMQPQSVSFDPTQEPMPPPPAYGLQAGEMVGQSTPKRVIPSGEIMGNITAPSVQMAGDFAAGLTGGQSPTYNALPDAMSPVLRKPISVLGDLGGAALGGVGVLLSGSAGLVGEAANMLGVRQPEKLANELLGMTQFAVPELAGASSIAANAARVSPTALAASERAGAAQATVQTAKGLGIPVMTTDALPPATGIGRFLKQTTPETIPIAGTGGPRAAQQSARIDAVRDLARQYGAEDIASVPDDIMADLLATRGAAVEKYKALKKGVIEKLSGPMVPLPKTVAAIDDEIAKLSAQKLASNDPVIAKLLEWRDGLMGVEVQTGPAGQSSRVATGQPLDQIEEIRKSIGEAFNDPGLAGVKSVGEKSLNAVYGPLREDMGNFIRATGGEQDFTKWMVANKELADGIKELGVAAFKAAMTKGELTPETVMRMVTSQTPSSMRLLYDNLSPKGRARVQSAVIGDVIEKSGGIDAISPERFLSDMKKRGSQLGVFFSEEDQKALKGLQDVLNITRQASKANVNVATGARAAPFAISAAAGSAASGLGASGTVAGITAAGIIGGIGGLGRAYESPAIRNMLLRYAAAKPTDKAALANQIILAINALEGKKEDRK